MRFVLAFAALLSSCGEQAAKSSHEEAPWNTGRAEWWLDDFIGQPNQRMGLFVFAELDGHTCKMQLDTGANDAVILYDGTTAKNPGNAEIEVSFAGSRMKVPTRQQFATSLASCSPDSPVGTLGNAFFEKGTLAIELATPSVRYAPDSMLRNNPGARPFEYWRGPAQTGGFPLIGVRSTDTQKAQALLDTGSAAFDLEAESDSDWTRLTHGAPLRAETHVQQFQISAWGKMHPCFQYRPGALLVIDALPPAQLPIEHCPSTGHIRSELLGTVGLKPFGNSTIVLDYPAQLWTVEPQTVKTSQ